MPPLKKVVTRFARRQGGRVLGPWGAGDGAAWDRAAGVRTDQWAELPDLTIGSAARDAGHPYGPTKPRLVTAMLDDLPPGLVEQSTFVDMGAGRGRVVLMASERPFRRVVGVEFARELHESACDNIARFPASRRRCDDVTSVHADATEYPIPSGPVVLYFDNPFSEAILGRVLANLASSYSDDPRPVVAIYTQQVHEEPQSTTRNLDLLGELPFLTGRTLRYSLRDRPFLSPFVLRIFASPEASAYERSARRAS